MTGKAFCCGLLVVVVFLPAGCVSVPGGERLSAVPGREVSAGERDFLVRYVENLRCRVYIKDGSGVEGALGEAVLRSARDCLSGQVTEELRGEEAVFDIELDVRGEGESRGENHYGTVYISCVVREPFFGGELDSLERLGPRTFSKAGQFDAQANAAQALLSVMMPESAVQARRLLLNLYERGLLYEIAVRGDVGKGSLEDFEDALAVRVHDLRIAGAVGPEARYAFTFFGFPGEVENAVLEAAAGAGLDGLKRSGGEGRALVFEVF
ncbi:MAG: hypothetical protein LBK13_05510 [Spirochaetales bacterium]|jgi:hypothetical protein|nr:hypothetical protein [Spirochaetales bacterium]